MDRKLSSVAFLVAISAFFFLASTRLEPDSAINSANEIGISSVALAQVSGKLIDVKAFGAKGNGLSDDTPAIQAAINAATEGTTISFPSGTYTVSNFAVKNRSGLTFVGEGRNSVIKHKTGAPRIATFSGSRDIVITNLTFDANGTPSYGGVMFYAVTRVRIENNWFIDSAPKPLRREDRFAFAFGKGSHPSRDIHILNNVIEDTQLEVDHAQRVIIDGNTVSRAVQTAGIGIFTVGDGAIAEDYQITRNTIIDPIGVGFNVGIDPPASRHCVFRRITIANNEIIRKKTANYGFRIGTPNSAQATAGNVFEDIVIKDNRVRIEPTAPAPRQMIFANSSVAAGIVFKRLIVTGNEIQNDGPPNKGYAIDLRRVQYSIVSENTVSGVANGISLTGELLANELWGNSVDASNVAYQVGASLGDNKGHGNRILSLPRIKLRSYGLKASDSMETVK